MQPRPGRPLVSSRSGPEGSANVTSAIGMEETVGHLRVRRQSLFTRTILWITGLVCAALLLATVAQAWSNSQLNEQLQTEQQKLQQLRDTNASLKQGVDHYKDPAVVEREARDQLGYARAGEQVVMIVPSGNMTPTSTQRRSQTQPQQGFWLDWWRLFFGG